MKLSDVFGVGSSAIKSYVQRQEVDDAFKAALGEGKHIVVYGASKQGKTALVSRYLPYKNNVVVRLDPNSNLEDIYSSILRQSGIKIASGETSAKTSEIGSSLGVKAKALIPFFGSGEASLSANLKSSGTDTENWKEVPFNLSVAQDVVELLNDVSFDKKVILENFHYLIEEEQRKLAFALRSFEEMGVVFVILGVWREKDRLRNYCGDLTDRVVDVCVEPWSDPDFYRVAKAGAEKLNIFIAPSVVAECVKSSFGSIGVFQELIKESCASAGVLRAQVNQQVVDDIDFARKALEEKSVQYGVTHRKSLELIASGNVSHSKEKAIVPLHLPYYMVMALLSYGERLIHGLSRSDVTAMIKLKHHRPDDVRPSDMTNLLHKISALQYRKGINPPILDYDIGKRQIYAVDSTFFFFLKNCDLVEVSEEMVSPLETELCD